MNTYYKIKVGIEEFPVKEEDITRIVDAMKSGNLVKLDCGVFRGQSIIAVCEDIEKQKLMNMLGSSGTTRAKEISTQEIITKQMSECKICDHSGWLFIDRNGERVAKYCTCTVLKNEVPKIENK